MDKADALRELKKQIEESLEAEMKNESFLTCILLDWLMKNEIVMPEHVAIFLDEYAAWAVANKEGLMNDNLLEGHT